MADAGCQVGCFSVWCAPLLLSSLLVCCQLLGCDFACLPQARGPTAYPSNAAFVQEYVCSLLASSFPNMTAVQIQAAVGGMMAIEDKRAFKHHMRDFLVQVSGTLGPTQVARQADSGMILWRAQTPHHAHFTPLQYCHFVIMFCSSNAFIKRPAALLQCLERHSMCGVAQDMVAAVVLLFTGHVAVSLAVHNDMIVCCVQQGF